MPSISLNTREQAALFECELQGQISDGHWENASPHNHWTQPSSAEVIISDETPHITFFPSRRYNFAADELLKVVRTRMIVIARLASRFDRKEIRKLESLFESFGDNCNALSTPELRVPSWMSCEAKSDAEQAIAANRDFFENVVCKPIKAKDVYNVSSLMKDLAVIKSAFSNVKYK